MAKTKFSVKKPAAKPPAYITYREANHLVTSSMFIGAGFSLGVLGLIFWFSPPNIISWVDLSAIVLLLAGLAYSMLFNTGIPKRLSKA